MITAIAVAIGVPLGVIVGRLVWKPVAAGVGAVDLVSIPWPMILVAPLAAAGCAGRHRVRRRPTRTARLQPAAVLRSE